MRKEVKLGIALCLALVLVVVGYLAYRSGDKTPDTSAAPQAQKPAASPFRPTTRPAAASPTRPPAARPTATPMGEVTPVRPAAGPTVAESPTTAPAAPAEQPAAPAPAAAPLPQMETTLATATPAAPLPKAPSGLTPMDTVAAGGAAQPPTGSSASGSVSEMLLKPLAMSSGTSPGGSTPGPGGTKIYTVASGDTLWKIAGKEYGDPTQMERIRKANPAINPDRLQVGQKLVIPPPGAQPATAAPARPAPAVPPMAAAAGIRLPAAAPAAPAAGRASYTVRAGDNPSIIAAREYGNPELYGAILKANPGLDPKKMRPGQQIVLPAKAQVLSAQPQRQAPAPAAARPAARPDTTARPAAPAPIRPAVTSSYVPGKPYFGD